MKKSTKKEIKRIKKNFDKPIAKMEKRKAKIIRKEGIYGTLEKTDIFLLLRGCRHYRRSMEEQRGHHLAKFGLVDL